MEIKVRSAGPEIIETNYWEHEYAARGLFFLTSNAGAFRLLVPEAHLSAVSEFRTAREVVVSRGPWPERGGREAIEILFDDGTDSPYALHLDARQLDRLPAAGDVGREWLFTAWVQGAGGRPVRVFEHECAYRLVPRLPWLKPKE
jgi:hypothetical protein